MFFVNFIVNIFLFSLLRRIFSFLAYATLKVVNIGSQLIFFQLALEFFFKGDVDNVISFGRFNFGSDYQYTLFLLLLSLFVIVFSSYFSRFFALSIIQDFIRYILDVKLSHKKNKTLSWLRPISLELWSTMDSFLVLICITVFGIYYIESLYFILLIVSVVVAIMLFSSYYIKIWKSTAPQEDRLFWRLKNQNIIESFMLMFMFSLMCIFVLASHSYNYEAKVIALLFLMLKVFVGMSTQMVSSIPRVARYFSKLPDWPVFWSKKIWL